MIHIDDFGTGYSSFSYLQRYPINALKIDQSFINNMGINGDRAEIVKTILVLAKELEMEVIAEGVETKNQYESLKALECTYGQGFFMSDAISPSMASELLKSQYELTQHFTTVQSCIKDQSQLSIRI